MKKVSSKFLFFAFSAILPSCLTAQSVKLTAKCGDATESAFTNTMESQEIDIAMNAGDTFEIMVAPIDDLLKIRAEIFEPGIKRLGTEIETDIMFKDETVRSIEFNSGPLNANGNYKIKLYNFDGGNPGVAGTYTVYFKCILANGDIINPK